MVRNAIYAPEGCRARLQYTGLPMGLNSCMMHACTCMHVPQAFSASTQAFHFRCADYD